MMTNKTNLKKSFMSNNRKKVKLTKVNIISLIDMLKKIYDDGADYIDIEGVPTDGEEDSIKIDVKPEYYTAGADQSDPEYMVTEQDYEEEFPPVSEDDINDLIE